MRRLVEDGQLELVSPEGVCRVTQDSLSKYLQKRVTELLEGFNEVAGTQIDLKAIHDAESRIEELERENERLRNSLLDQRQDYAALSDDLGAYTAPKIPNH